MNLKRVVCLFVTATLAACAKEEASTSPDIGIQIDFQSTAAAVATDSVKVFVFQGVLGCNDLIRLRQTEQPLPPRLTETPSMSPCQLQNNVGNTVQLELEKDYTMLAIGQIGGKDVLAGCTHQPAYGATRAIDITVALIDDRQKLSPPQCAKLSDKCSGACR
jgi:hypothetical protein